MKLNLLRKQFNKRNLLLLFVIIFLSIAPALIIQASSNDVIQPDSYRLYATTTKNVLIKRGTSTVINRSDKDYLIPNKTTPEWDSFAKNPPKYVEIGICDVDGVCGAGEDSTSCPEDCPVATGYCGDGICSNTQVDVPYPGGKLVDKYEKICVTKRTGWMWVPVVNFVLWATGNENYTKCNYGTHQVLVYHGWETAGEVYATTTSLTKQQVCKDDCMPPSGSGCGSCGYDSSGNLCPNYCSNRGYNMINCSYHSASTSNSSGCSAAQAMVYNTNPTKKYFTASEALAYASAVMCQDSSFTVSGGYGCDYGGDTSSMCPAGSYCKPTGGLKPGITLTNYATPSWLSANGYTAADLQRTCDAGSFCPLGSIFQRICPKNTYSTGGASVCTACPAGTISMPGASSVDFCMPFYKANDGVCQNPQDGINGETPANSPKDCPDSTNLAVWKGDGRCTGIENMTNSPDDCKCGNGICDNSESPLSCLTDCACMDSTCGTATYINNAYTVFKEGNTCNSYGNIIANQSDCKYMNAGEVCGNGVCENGEKYRSDIGRIVCPLDCHCGDGYCGSGETMANCALDCFCGDGTCNHGEYYGSCISDCHCGNGQCDYGENALDCATDCRCGDHICSYGENTCTTDCGAGSGICGDGICGTMDLGNGKMVRETISNCPDDCGKMQLQ